MSRLIVLEENANAGFVFTSVSTLRATMIISLSFVELDFCGAFQRFNESRSQISHPVKPASKPNFQSPNKRRPQVRNLRVGSRTQSETSSVGDSVEAEDNVLASAVKVRS